MSDDNNQTSKPNPLKTQQIKKTSAVPLRKETVRVTLKAPGAQSGVPVPPTAPAPSTPAAPAPKAMTPNTNNISANTDKVSAKVDPSKLTASVPLKQETMRVTLKADKPATPAAPAPAPAAPKAPAPAAAAPKAPAAPVAPKAPSAPSAPKAPAAPSAPKPASPAPAPTIPLGGAPGGAKPAVAAPTIPLGLATGAPAPTVPLATQPLQSGGASQQLPKATVQLQQTQQLTQGLGAPSQAATIQTVSDDDLDEKTASASSLPLSIIAFVLSLVVLYFCFNHANIWVEKHQDGDIMSVFDGLRGE